MSYPPRETLPDLPVLPVSKAAKEAEKELVDAILRVKRAALCVICGNDKEPGRWFDKTCYYTLPLNLRGRLWTCHEMSDAELRENFTQAIDYLCSRGQRFVPRQKMPHEAQLRIAETRFSEALTAFLTERP